MVKLFLKIFYRNFTVNFFFKKNTQNKSELQRLVMFVIFFMQNLQIEHILMVMSVLCEFVLLESLPSSPNLFDFVALLFVHLLWFRWLRRRLRCLIHHCLSYLVANPFYPPLPPPPGLFGCIYLAMKMTYLSQQWCDQPISGDSQVASLFNNSSAVHLCVDYKRNPALWWKNLCWWKLQRVTNTRWTGIMLISCWIWHQPLGLESNSLGSWFESFISGKTKCEAWQQVFLIQYLTH